MGIPIEIRQALKNFLKRNAKNIVLGALGLSIGITLTFLSYLHFCPM